MRSNFFLDLNPTRVFGQEKRADIKSVRDQSCKPGKPRHFCVPRFSDMPERTRLMLVLEKMLAQSKQHSI